VNFILFVEDKTEYDGVGKSSAGWDARLFQQFRGPPIKFDYMPDYCGDIRKKVYMDLSAASCKTT
jgi:hypothetical protein